MSEVSQQEEIAVAEQTDRKDIVHEEAPREEAPAVEMPAAMNGDAVEDEETADENGTAEEDGTADDSDAANEDEGEDDDDESDSEDEVGFTPTILEGKRERTSTSKWVPEGKDPNEEKKERQKLDEDNFGAGSGTRLGDIPFIEFSINKEDTKELVILHRICFGMRSKGKKGNLTKRHLRDFSGYPYGKDDKRYESRENLLKSLHKPVLLQMARLIGIECTSTTPNVELHEAFMEFLLCPQDNGKAIPEKGRTPTRTKKPNKKSKKKKKDPNAPKRPMSAYFHFLAEHREQIKLEQPEAGVAEIAKRGGEMWRVEEDKSKWEKLAKKATNKYNIDIAEYKENKPESEESEDESQVKRKSSSKKSEENPKKRKSSSKKKSEEAPKKRKSSSKKKSTEEVVSSGEEDEEEPEKAAKKKTPKKSTAVAVVEPKKKVKTPTKKKTPVKRKASSGDASSSEDDQPLVKKKKDEPSDDEVKAVIKSILKSANLEEVTMKSVCTQVYERYPDKNMQERKEFIKNTVKMIIS